MTTRRAGVFFFFAFCAAFGAAVVIVQNTMGGTATAILGAATAVLGVLAVQSLLADAARRRREVMLRFGFRPAPNDLDQLIRDANAFQVFGASWFVERDRLFRGTVDGIQVWYFDWIRPSGDSFSPGASVVAALGSELRAHVNSSTEQRLKAPELSASWKIRAAPVWTFCWIPEKTLALDETAISSFIREAKSALVGSERKTL